MKLNDIRKNFLEYFERNDHIIMDSAPLVPQNDPSLMFVNSGMVQFKNYFTGIDKPKVSKVTTSQKCVRAGGKHNDLDNVGYTARHHTFFEMLGNFAFQGAYFKDQAILLAWNFLISELGLNKERLYITVFEEDEDARRVWKKVTGFSDEKIIGISTSDNFWSMGDTGPCGPCTEIFYDHGEKYSGGLPGSKNQDGDRYIEIWNIVFMQYNQLINGSREVLPSTAIDTGMGLERIAAVVQGVNDNYEIDLFRNLINASYQIIQNDIKSPSHKVIADHLRSAVFLISDGVLPSNEGRGYVLRRIIRRAMRHVNSLSCNGKVLSVLSELLIQEMHDAYPEIKAASSLVKSTLENEEEKFADTLSRGIKLLEAEISTIPSGGMLNGKKAFLLYDTYGFPIDLTIDFLLQHGIKVDEAGFDKAMLEQKNRSSWKGSGEISQEKLWFELDLKPTEFCGYEKTACTATILSIIQNGEPVNTAKIGTVFVIFNKTPFYAESGGQVSDTGFADKNAALDVQKEGAGLFVHKVLLNEEIKVGTEVYLSVNNDRREMIAANHSATHLLHKALKDMFGDHVVQKGSLVNESKLRFDFTHNSKVSNEDLLKIERIINCQIRKNCEINAKLMAKQEAVQSGALALFGEKYGDIVRVISMGDSIELCGGTHARKTSDIGIFKIISEEAVASGVRRIEAITGNVAIDFFNSQSQSIKKIAEILKINEDGIKDEIINLKQKNAALERELSLSKIKLLYSSALFKKADDIVIMVMEADEDIDLKIAADYMKKQDTVIVLFIKNTTICIFSYSNLIVAGDLLKVCIENTGAKGGGNKAVAQAGGLKILDKERIKRDIEEIVCQIQKKAVK